MKTAQQVTSDAIRKSGQHWTEHDRKAKSKNVNQGRNFGEVHQHVNEKICGRPIAGKGNGLLEKLASRFGASPLGRGISIGCGNGAPEMGLIENGLVESFDLYEASEGRIADGLVLAEKKQLSDKVNFTHVDGTELPQAAEYDLVYWKAALHHMFDVRSAVEWSRNALRKGGFFVMDEYVGPDRFQWTDLSLKTCNDLRSIFPEEYFYNPQDPNRPIPRTLKRSTVEKVIKSDPTESVQSSQIVPAVQDVFPNGEVMITGGALYHLVLRGIAGNIPKHDVPSVLRLVLGLDDLLLAQGDYHFAVCVAERD